jgi:hypothetical protein
MARPTTTIVGHLRELVPILVGTIGATVLVASFTFLSSTPFGSSVRSRIFDLTVEVERLRTRTDVLDKRIQQLTAPPPGQASSAQLSASIKQLRSDVDGLNAAILADPSKALAVPMLRRDMDSLAQRSRDDVLAIRDEIGRVYDLTKWFIGLMLTMALGLIGLAFTNFIQARKAQ